MTAFGTSAGRERDLGSGDARSGEYVAIVCVTHDSARLLPAFFDSVPEQVGGKPLEVHVVDSGSRDGTVEDVRRLSPKAVIHEMDGNRGFAAGINAAVSALGKRRDPPCAVVIVNPDVRFRTSTADELVAALRSRLAVGVAVPRLVGEDGRLQLSLRRRPTPSATWAEAICGGPIAHYLGMPTEVIRDERVYERDADVGWATGGFLAVSWDCLSTVGRWDESYFLYEEEVDFCLRATDLGFVVRYAPAAVGVRILDRDQTPPWVQALMRANRVRHVRKRSGNAAATLVRAGLLVGDAARGSAGRLEGRAGFWAMATGASVEQILDRYRPDARAMLSRAAEDEPESSVTGVIRVLRAYISGREVLDVLPPAPQLLSAAQWHQVAGIVCSVVDVGPCGAFVRRAHALRSLQQEHALDQTARALDADGIDWLLLKGAVLSEVVYRVPGVRESADLDVLVLPEDFERAVRALQSAGARLVDVNWPLIRQQERGELSLVLPGGALVDLHWHVINEPTVRSEVALDTAGFFGRTRTVTVGSRTVRTLGEVDTAVYAAVHAWKSGGDRLKWMLDVQQTAVRVGDESAILDRARMMRVEVPTLLMLRRAERVLGGMPRAARRTSVAKRAVLIADCALTQMSRTFDRDVARPFSGRILLRSARDGVAGPRAAVRSLGDMLRHRLGRTGTASQEQLRHPVESVIDRNAYFAAVGRGSSAGPGR